MSYSNTNQRKNKNKFNYGTTSSNCIYIYIYTVSNVRIIMEVGLGKMWKEVAVAYFKNMPRILLEENNKQITQYNDPLGLEMTSGTVKYVAEVLTTHLWHSLVPFQIKLNTFFSDISQTYTNMHRNTTDSHKMEILTCRNILCVSFQGLHTCLVLIVPYLNKAIICSRNQIWFITTMIIINTVHTFLMAFESKIRCWWSQLPNLQCYIFQYVSILVWLFLISLLTSNIVPIHPSFHYSLQTHYWSVHPFKLNTKPHRCKHQFKITHFGQKIIQYLVNVNLGVGICA